MNILFTIRNTFTNSINCWITFWEEHCLSFYLVYLFLYLFYLFPILFIYFIMNIWYRKIFFLSLIIMMTHPKQLFVKWEKKYLKSNLSFLQYDMNFFFQNINKLEGQLNRNRPLTTRIQDKKMCIPNFLHKMSCFNKTIFHIKFTFHAK